MENTLSTKAKQVAADDIDVMLYVASRHNIDVWSEIVYEHICKCGNVWNSTQDDYQCHWCDSPAKETSPASIPPKQGFFWQSCCTGCLPDSDLFGPFNSLRAALEDATDDLLDYDSDGALTLPDWAK